MNVLNEEVYDDYEPQWDGSKTSLAVPAAHVGIYLNAFEECREQFSDTANISVSSSVPGLYSVLVTGLSSAQLMYYCAFVYSNLPPDAMETPSEAAEEPETGPQVPLATEEHEDDDSASEEPQEAEESSSAPTPATMPSRQVVVQRKNRPVVVKTGNPNVTIEETSE